MATFDVSRRSVKEGMVTRETLEKCWHGGFTEPPMLEI